MVKTSFIFMVFSIFIFQAFGQKTTQKISFGESFDLKIGYLGEFITHPGLNTEIMAPYKLQIKTKNDRQKWKYLSAGFGIYNHQQNHVGTFLLVSHGSKRIYKNGFMLGSSLGVGYFRYFYNSATFEVGDNGEISRVRLAGKGQIMFDMSLEVGQDFFRKSNVPLGWYIRPRLFFLAPHNTTFLPRVALEAGIMYKIKIN
ncbi:MAG: hypothetical protein HC819_04735 [Cyclobacteriaceae bacterium]|nr:hypothetical protein [Cyclobacteriaceae bacterium]